MGQDIWQASSPRRTRRCRNGHRLRGREQRLLRVGYRRHRHERVRAAAPIWTTRRTRSWWACPRSCPVGVRGLILAAAMAATMSVSSGTILASSTILYNDLYPIRSQGRPMRTTHLKEVTITRLFALLIGVVVMIVLRCGSTTCWWESTSRYGYLSGCVFVPAGGQFRALAVQPGR